ncbi:MAG: hypothetical protein ACC612_11415 [Methanomethylovorans sp.]|uniref:hypothetical protein n=1 Tax=Methanomethylovorans sp. TaxID=2758717 RepID=UPI00353140E0
MEQTLFSFIFLLSSVSFFGFFVTQDRGVKIITSLLSTILFYLTALASFAIEKILDSGELYTYASPTFAGVCRLFATLSFVLGIAVLFSYFKKKPGSEEQ